MTKSLHLLVTTPFDVLIDVDDVRALRVEDASGSFGILPGHADFMTVLPVSILRWRDSADVMHYCALRGGVLSVSNGTSVEVACRQGMLGDDLEQLAAEVAEFEAEERDAEKRARTSEMKMHASAVRQIVSLLDASGTGGDKSRFGGPSL